MRLIHIHANGFLSFQDFFNKERPRYAILPHRWGTDEVLYEDFKHGRGHDSSKLAGCAAQARKDKLEYMWIDTCCIDKSTSSELTEAVNSMYAWYAGSAKCYAYLNDVTGDDFAESLWFSRGWTLQELIAPRIVEFFNGSWSPIGNKQERLTELADITGITRRTLEGWTPLQSSVAERMYWASKRVTTRIEDTAYCLMGIFDVNMPLLYGEGTKAFRRLQEEIIRQTNDCTVFAWSVETGSGSTYEQPLAPGPQAFGHHPWLSFYGEYAPPAIENTSIRLDVLLKPVEGQPSVFYGLLDCIRADESFASILLLEIDSPRWGSQKGRRRFLRVAPERVDFHDIPVMSEEWMQVENVSIQTLSPNTLNAHRPELSLKISVYGPEPSDVWSEGLHTQFNSGTTQEFLTKAEKGVQVALLYKFGKQGKILLLGLNHFGRPCCRVIQRGEGQSLNETMKHTSRHVSDQWPSSGNFDQYHVNSLLFCMDRRVVFRAWITERPSDSLLGLKTEQEENDSKTSKVHNSVEGSTLAIR